METSAALVLVQAAAAGDKASGLLAPLGELRPAGGVGDAHMAQREGGPGPPSLPPQGYSPPKLDMIFGTAGPRITTKRAGKIRKTIGKSILIGAF